jgi:GTPase SAR1 family protein
VRIVVLGLGGAGKTSLLQSLAASAPNNDGDDAPPRGTRVPPAPTTGASATHLQRDSVQYNIIDGEHSVFSWSLRVS